MGKESWVLAFILGLTVTETVGDALSKTPAGGILAEPRLPIAYRQTDGPDPERPPLELFHEREATLVSSTSAQHVYGSFPAARRAMANPANMQPTIVQPIFTAANDTSFDWFVQQPNPVQHRRRSITVGMFTASTVDIEPQGL